MRRWSIAAAALFGFAATIGLVVTAGAGGSASHDELIPRKLIFGNPVRTIPLVSPDGSKIMFTAPVDGVMNVWVAPIDDLAAAKPITKEKSRPIRKTFWAKNGTHILYMQDERGNENYHIFSVEIATEKVRDLTPYRRTRADLIAQSAARPDEILVGLNNRDARWHDAWLVNVVTGVAKLVQKNPGFGMFIADNDLAVRLATKPMGDGGREVLRLDGGEWKPFMTIGPDDVMTTDTLFFSADNQSLYMFDSRGRDKSALTRVDLRTGASKVLAESDKADIAYVVDDPKTREILAYSSQYERMSWKALKPSVKADIDVLDREMAQGYWSLLSQSDDNRLWTLWVDNVTEPIKFALYDRKTRKLKTLFSARPNLEGKPLPPLTSHIIKARDGLNLVSYLSLPNGSDVDGNGIPDKPLPMVLNVHGGPWDRDYFGYLPERTWLANRGYAVLAVNFRGSTGFGKAFVNAGDKEWAGKMHDDLLDAVKWAVDKGIADKDKIAIYGGSYGGYAALVGLTFTPETFACGVDMLGPSNLNTMLSNLPPYWAPFIDTFKRRVGDPTTSEGRKLLKARSPLFRAAKIQRPLLIAQGANDIRVKQSEADQIVRAMTKKGLPVTYALYSDEGHGFARPENRVSFYAISEVFLAQCLGGRFEPIGDDLEGSSVAVPTGKERIPGLKEALAEP